MLDAIESLFYDALQAGLPPGMPLSAGPSFGPTSPGQPLVALEAQTLTLSPPPSDDLTEIRSRARFSVQQRWDSNGTQQDFTLPEPVTGELVEVEAPLGHPMRPGDDYLLEGRILRFFRAPAAGTPGVIARLNQGPAQGFVEPRRADVALRVRVWEQRAADADRLMRQVLPLMLTASVEMPAIESWIEPETGVRARLKAPALTLMSLQREALTLEQKWFCVTADFLLRGQLELTVTLGAPQPEGLIEQLVYRETHRSGQLPPRTP